MSCPKILVLFYGYGSIVDLAKEIGEGVKEAGGEVKLARLRSSSLPRWSKTSM